MVRRPSVPRKIVSFVTSNDACADAQTALSAPNLWSCQKKFKARFPSPPRGGEGRRVRGRCTALPVAARTRGGLLDRAQRGSSRLVEFRLTPIPSPALGREEPICFR